jgi:hypothetical protein
MSGIERRVARLEKAEGEIKIDVAEELIKRLAEKRAARRRGDWIEPSYEEKIARLRASLQEPMSAETRELIERRIRALEITRRDDHATQS